MTTLLANVGAARRVREFRRVGQDLTLLSGLLVAVAFVAIAILWPLATMLGTVFSAEAFPVFVRFLTKPVYLAIIRNTVVLGLTVAAAGTALGFLFAFVQERVAAPRLLKRLLHIMALVPVVSPPFAVAIAVLTLFGRSGIITYRMLGVRGEIYGLPGLTLVMTLSFFTVAYLGLGGMLRALDPSLDEAATNLGAGKWHTFRTVTIPMLGPGLASSFLLLFVEAIADLGNPIVLGGDFTVLAARLYIAITGEYDILAGAVLSVILLVPSLIVYLVQRYWAGRASIISVTGKPSGRTTLLTDPRVALPLLGLAVVFALLILLIYVTVFAGALTQLLGINNAFTWEHFKFVLLGYGSKAMIDTTLLAGIATPLAGLLGMLIAFLVVRKQFTGRGALDFATMLGLAVPGTVFGIGYLLAFNDPLKLGGVVVFPKLTGGAAVLGGALAIVLVYIIRSTPAGLRIGVAALQQIDPAIEEASVSLGADQARTFRKVTLPLIRPAFFSGLVYSFARSMTTISAIIFLTTPNTRIMTQQILNETDAGRYGNAFAYVVILVAIVLAGMAIMNAVVGTRTGAERALMREVGG